MADFDDWEMLQPELDEQDEIGYGVAANVESEGLMMLRLDYFSVDSETGDTSEVSIEGRSVDSDGPSWIDPAESEAVVFQRRDSGEFWPDSGSDRSKMSDYGGEMIGLAFVQSGDDHHVFEVENQSGCVGQLRHGIEGDLLGAVEYGGLDEVEKTIVFSDESADKMDLVGFPEEDVCNGIEMGIRGEEGCVEAVEDAKIGKEVVLPSEVEKKTVIWWKVPIELVKFCVFRVSPLWSILVAAAMLGVFIMRRRLQSMKRKTKGLQMKVTMDHKKVDQFMSRAAHLNEAFSVVKRIPLIRPSLPAPVVIPWPVMNMR